MNVHDFEFDHDDQSGFGHDAGDGPDGCPYCGHDDHIGFCAVCICDSESPVLVEEQL